MQRGRIMLCRPPSRNPGKRMIAVLAPPLAMGYTSAGEDLT
jgi:hypothetical protein